MNDKTYQVLELNKIKEKLAGEASSAMAKAAIGRMEPSLNLHRIREWQAETSEAVSVIVHKGALTLGNYFDICSHVSLAEKGGVLTMEQLLQVLYNLQAARHACAFLKGDLPDVPRINAISELLSIHKDLEQEIDRSILSEDEMADDASPELKRLRRSIALKNEGIRNKMSSILTSYDNKGFLQDAVITLRQGRYVVPIKQEHRQKFTGIIHDQSSSGATLFIEPQIIVNMNNDLRELESAEKREIQRILASLSLAVAGVADGLRNNQELLTALDIIFARGKLSCSMKGEEPTVNEGCYLRLKEARHPLIDQNLVVPITLSIGSDYHTLVITGPNTGGKTVTLKTVGLLLLMAQSGLHIPAEAGSEIPVMRQVFADIGDEQSIEQSLSTFSSHMANIVNIIKEADSDTLILLDELGAGTDPTEGAALAISVLKNLYEKKALTIATTHYTELKKFAIATSGIQNASMEFNVDTLSPTFRLVIGTPGKSNAFEIASKLGLPAELIEYARGLLGRNDIAFEDVIASIEKDRKTALEERDIAISLRLEMDRRREELEREKEDFERRKGVILAKAKEEAGNIVRETRDFADLMRKDLENLKTYENITERNRDQEAIRKKLRNRQEQYREKITVPSNKQPVDPSQLRLGDRVWILSLNQKGEVIALPDEKNEMQVSVGLMKINVNVENVSRIEQGGSGTKRNIHQRYGRLYESKVKAIDPTINVLGKVLDDALLDVDKYLDDAYIAGLKEVTVIHGRGTGTLREGLGHMFKSHKHVKGYRKGTYQEGGDGVTVVTLKSK